MARTLHVEMSEREYAIFQNVERIVKRLLKPGLTEQQVMDVLEKTIAEILEPTAKQGSEKHNVEPPSKP